MDWTANVAVHESASPGFMREQILSALQQARVHPHLLYAGLRQAALWQDLHVAYSPAQRDDSCVGMYEEAFNSATGRVRGNVAHVVSFGCGDGSKDVRCLRSVRASDRPVMYTPVDLSLDLVLTASRTAATALPGLQVTPLLCDLPQCSVLPAILKSFDPSGAERLLLFLGTLHNYWPPEILRSILYPLRSQDQFLISANLARASTYDTDLESILPQYDNEPTRRWLWGGLSELGLSEEDGELRIGIQNAPNTSSKRIQADFYFRRGRRIRIMEEEVEFAAGAALQVFFSFRFTPQKVEEYLSQAGLSLAERWISPQGDEGLFLCLRSPSQ